MVQYHSNSNIVPYLSNWTRRHFMTSAYVIRIPSSSAASSPPPPMFPNLKTKIVITQSIFELGP